MNRRIFAFVIGIVLGVVFGCDGIAIAQMRPNRPPARDILNGTPPNAELNRFPVEPKKELGANWREKLGLRRVPLDKKIDAWNYRRGSKTWVWDTTTLTPGTFVYVDRNGVPRYKAECERDGPNDWFDNRLVLLPIPEPIQGPAGKDGVSCWDTNENGQRDPDEDKNGDGVVNVLDCRGRDGRDGVDGEDGRDGKDGQDFTPIVLPWELGFTASATPKFDSSPITNGVDSWLGQEADLSGTSFDIGLTYGKPEAYYFRFVLDWKKLSDESTTRYSECDECGNRTVVHHFAESVSMIGPKAEFVLPFLKTTMKPMVSIYAGVSYVMGDTLRGECPEGQLPVVWERGTGRDMFGKSWVPYVGGDVGILARLSDKFDITATVGADSLGVHPIRIGANFRF